MNLPASLIVACSGGPDSMALLDMLRVAGKDLLCAHVNYHLRQEANAESALVQRYCARYQIPLYRLDAFYSEGNMEAWAREVRYRFFAQIAKRTGVNSIVLAHHYDDLLETYLLQKERKAQVNYWGLPELRRQGKLNFYRPLLKKTKQELLTYCQQHQLAYGIDSSNTDMRYRRNYWRQQLLLWSEEEKNACELEIRQLNQQQRQEEALCEAFCQRYPKHIPLDDFFAFAYPQRLLRKLLYRNLSQHNIQEILRLLRSHKRFKMVIRHKMLVVERAGIDVFYPPTAFCVTLTKSAKYEHPYFSLRKEGQKKEGIWVQEKDFPLKIRSGRRSDCIQLRYGHKKLSRYFIDQHIPWRFRDIWPVVENVHGEIIFIAGIGCDKYHYSDSPSFFLVNKNV